MEHSWNTSNLPILVRVPAYLLGWCNTRFGGFEGLQAAPHGALEDLLHLVLILVDVQVTPAVPVSVLSRDRTQESRADDDNR